MGDPATGTPVGYGASRASSTRVTGLRGMLKRLKGIAGREEEHRVSLVRRARRGEGLAKRLRRRARARARTAARRKRRRDARTARRTGALPGKESGVSTGSETPGKGPFESTSSSSWREKARGARVGIWSHRKERAKLAGDAQEGWSPGPALLSQPKPEAPSS